MGISQSGISCFNDKTQYSYQIKTILPVTHKLITSGNFNVLQNKNLNN